MPGEQLTIATTDGNRFVFQLTEIGRITSEPGSAPKGTGTGKASQSWYTTWSIGPSSVSYGDEEVDQMLEFLDELPGVERTIIIWICSDSTSHRRMVDRSTGSS